MTNNHVVSGSRNITVTLSDKRQYQGTVLGIDRRSDLAILKIHADRKLPFVRLGDSDALVVGQKVLAIGNPFGLEGTLTTGIVSSLGRSLEGEEGNTLEGLIQTDAAINPGNSGGPLLDSRGDVIGINTAIYGSQTASGEAGSIGIGFAMPINRAKEKLEEYRTTGHISHPVLGVSQTQFDTGRSGRGARDAALRRPADRSDRRWITGGGGRAAGTEPDRHRRQDLPAWMSAET